MEATIDAVSVSKFRAELIENMLCIRKEEEEFHLSKNFEKYYFLL